MFLSFFIQSFAVSVRRFHDIGKNGWWFVASYIIVLASCFFSAYYFLDDSSILVFVWLAKDSQPGANKWGPNPKEQNHNAH